MPDIAPLGAGQQWAAQWYPSTVTNLIAISGRGPDDPTTGQPMPVLSPVDTLAILGLVTPAVINAISNWTVNGNRLPIGSDAIASAFTEVLNDTDGALSGDPGRFLPSDLADGKTANGFVDAKTYLGYLTDAAVTGQVSSTPWKRFSFDKQAIDAEGNVSVDPLDAIDQANASVEIFWTEATFGEGGNGLFQFVRQLIADWQRMVDCSALSFTAHAANIAEPMDENESSTFLAALRSVCVDFDVLSENPPELNRITSALKDALDKSAEFAGKAAAEIAHQVGKYTGIIATNVAGGFLSEATMVSLIVVAVVVHLYL